MVLYFFLIFIIAFSSLQQLQRSKTDGYCIFATFASIRVQGIKSNNET